MPIKWCWADRLEISIRNSHCNLAQKIISVNIRGYIPAAARLADPKRELPLQVYLAEASVTAEEMCDRVNDQLKKDGRCIVVVSEGFELGMEGGEARDSFGHKNYGSAKMSVQAQVVAMLNDKGLPVPGAAR